MRVFAPNLADVFATPDVFAGSSNVLARPAATHAAILMCVEKMELIFARI
jgi:hypothetical protein